MKKCTSLQAQVTLSLNPNQRTQKDQARKNQRSREVRHFDLLFWISVFSFQEDGRGNIYMVSRANKKRLAILK
jgi:hypothetical protein